MKKNSIREFVLRRLDEGADAMTIYREALDRFYSCGWLYVLKLKREWDQSRNAA